MGSGAALESNRLAIDQDGAYAFGNRVAASGSIANPQCGQVVDQYIGRTAGGGIGAMAWMGAGIKIAKARSWFSHIETSMFDGPVDLIVP
ncbi:hypothetical protein D3C78_1106650 [compost metagenome]